eukprot:scaffold890_cov269-Pinguiococcus_pyrenoidosus.AAC.9
MEILELAELAKEGKLVDPGKRTAVIPLLGSTDNGNPADPTTGSKLLHEVVRSLRVMSRYPRRRWQGGSAPSADHQQGCAREATRWATERILLGRKR